MTSKEALDKLWEMATNQYEYALDDEQSNIEIRKIIEEDLIILEIIKKYSNHNEDGMWLKYLYFAERDKNAKKVLKEWLGGMK